MLIPILLLLVFTVLGMPFVLLQKQPKDFLFAPILGLAAFVGIGYFISASLGMPGSQAMAISLLILVILTVLVSLVGIKNSKYGLIKVKKEIQFASLCLFPGLLILLPAMAVGVDVFFGSVNFDFFFNTQDSHYLTNHSVLQYAVASTDAIFPLTWSANLQGRFAISLIGSFANRYLELDPLHFNAQLLTTLVLLFSLSAGAFVKYVYRFRGFQWFIAVSAIILSAGFSQGYIYYLLGQISALPLFLLILAIASRLMNEEGEGAFTKNNRWDLFAIILLLNSLYVFYAILAFFAMVIIGVALIVRLIQDRQSATKIIYRFGYVLLGFVLIFVLARILLVEQTISSIMEWIHLSTKTASSSTTAPLVFSEYLTEGFLVLFFGIFNYPINASFFNHFLTNGLLYNCLTLSIGLIALICITWAMFKFLKSSKFNTSLIIALVITTLGCGFLFFITKSGYAIFKINSWFIPLILPVFIGAIFLPKRGKHRILDSTFSILCAFIIIMNALTTATYLYVFFPRAEYNTFLNSKGINGFREMSELAPKLNSKNQQPLIFDLNDGIKNAWAANEFRFSDIEVLTHNLQPLADRIPPSTPCKHEPIFVENMFLIHEKYDPLTLDVTHELESAAPIMGTDHYEVYNTEDIETYSFIGQGSFPTEHLPDIVAKQSGLPKTFRWVESGVEVFIYSRKPKSVNINIQIIPGYVDGSKIRQLTVLYGKKRITTAFSKENSDIHLKDINLNAGLNCFYLESKDNVSRPKRAKAIIRSDVPLDFRLLNFALGEFSIQK